MITLKKKTSISLILFVIVLTRARSNNEFIKEMQKIKSNLFDLGEGIEFIKEVEGRTNYEKERVT